VHRVDLLRVGSFFSRLDLSGYRGISALRASPVLPYIELVVPLIVAGSGVSMAMPAAQNAVLGSVTVTEMGKASGVFNMGRFLGGMFGIALLVTVFSASGAVDTPAHFSKGFTAAMSVAAVLSLAGAFVGLWLPGRGSAVHPRRARRRAAGDRLARPGTGVAGLSPAR